MMRKVICCQLHVGLRKIYNKFTFIKPFACFVKQKFFKRNLPPKFSGWGMETQHELPWVDRYHWDAFRKANEDIKRNFEFVPKVCFNSANMDEHLWRHWIVVFSVRYALEFSKSSDEELNFVECGVADGVSVFFALREIRAYIKNGRPIEFIMHLFDSWSSMREHEILTASPSMREFYANLSLERTRRNLSEFTHNLVYHQGYVPESFKISPLPPETIIFLHIDINSAIATLACLEFFYPRMLHSGVILFDDYGWEGYEDIKDAVDKFFVDKPGILMKLPTGQAIYFINK